MKSLRDYIEEKQTELFENTGAFFAFSQEQFNQHKKEGVKYVSLNHGMICPKDKVDNLIDGLEQIQEEGIKKDLEENGKEAIIMRELGNYETQISMDISDAVSALKKYGFTEIEIQKIYDEKYFPLCLEKDWF